MSICLKKSEDETSISKNISNSSTKGAGDLGTYSCTVCYESYKKVILTAAQAENIFGILCKCLRVKSGSTAFAFNHGSDFPLCESCSEFALDIVKLSRKLEAIQDTIQEKIEEVVETIIETELARKEEILKFRDSHLEEIKLDRRVDSFRKQVIKSCEEIASSYEDTEINFSSYLYDGEGDHKYAELFKNFKVKKDIFESDSLHETIETEKPVVSLNYGDTTDGEDKKNTEIVMNSDNLPLVKPEPLFKEPGTHIDSINIKLQEKVKDNDAVLPSNDTTVDSKLASLKLEANNTPLEKEEPIVNYKEQINSDASTKSGDFTILNYYSTVVVPTPSLPSHTSPVDLEFDQNSSETTVFDVQSPCKGPAPAASFEQILKNSCSDDEKEKESFKMTENTDVPKEIVPNDCDEGEEKEEETVCKAEQPLDKTLKKPRFSWGKVEYSDGKAFFQSIEIKLLNKDRSKVQCSLCQLVTKNSKGKNAIMKMRTHMVATHLRVYQCPACQEKCKDYFNLLEHMKSHDDTLSQKSIPQEKFLCQFCSQICKSQSGLDMHVAWRHEESTDRSAFNTISLAVIKETISMVQQPNIEKVGNPITVKRKVGRPRKRTRAPNQLLNGNSSSGKPRESQLGRSKQQGPAISAVVGPRKAFRKILGLTKATKRPLESGQSTRSLTDSEQSIKKHRGPGRPRKSESLNKKRIMPVHQMNGIVSPSYFENSKTSLGSKIDEGNIGAITNLGSCKRGRGRPRKIPAGSATVSKSDTCHSETKDCGNSPNVYRSSNKSPVPYIALKFNANSDSEDSDSIIEEYFNVKSSNVADPLSVDEELGNQNTQKISQKSRNAVGMNLNCNPVPWADKPETIDIDLTESDTEVVDVEEDNKMPIVTSTISLASQPIHLRQLLLNPTPPVPKIQKPQPLLQQLLENQTLPTTVAPVLLTENNRHLLQQLLGHTTLNAETASSFHTLSNHTTVPNFKIADESLTMPIVNRPVVNASSGVPARGFTAGNFASPANSETASSILAKEKHLKYLETLNTHVGKKVVEIVRNRSNDCKPVAVLSHTATKKLSCGSCGYQNEIEYENPASALKAIKIHIYQKHFFAPQV